MRRTTSFAAVVALGCHAAPARSLGPISIGQAERMMVVDGVERTYEVHVPKSYRPTQATPLVVLLHGYGSNGRQIERYSRFGELAESEGFVLIAPVGSGRGPGWNAGFYNLGGKGVDDLKFVAKLIDEAEHDLNIDPKRVYVAGHSSGAIMSYGVAAHYSNRIAAIGVVEGSAGSEGILSKGIAGAPTTPVSAIVIHGTADRMIPYDQATKKRFNPLMPGSDSAKAWAKNDGLDGPPKRTDISATTHVDTWSRNGIEVKFVTIDGGSHMWPGMAGGPGSKNAVDATAMLWSFFKTHPKR